MAGSKRFITNGGIADVHVVFATTDPTAGWGGLRAFIFDKGNPGLKAARKERKLGVRASHAGEVILADCFVRAKNLLGGDGAQSGIGLLKRWSVHVRLPLLCGGNRARRA